MLRASLQRAHGSNEASEPCRHSPNSSVSHSPNFFSAHTGSLFAGYISAYIKLFLSVCSHKDIP